MSKDEEAASMADTDDKSILLMLRNAFSNPNWSKYWAFYIALAFFSVLSIYGLFRLYMRECR